MTPLGRSGGAQDRVRLLPELLCRCRVGTSDGAELCEGEKSKSSLWVLWAPWALTYFPNTKVSSSPPTPLTGSGQAQLSSVILLTSLVGGDIHSCIAGRQRALA